MVRTVRFHELGGPEVLRLEDAPIAAPGAGELLIRVDAIGVNRAEVLFRSGRYIEDVREFPGRLGTEAAGVVEAVGPGVAGFAAGDRVSVVPAFSMNDYSVYAERAVVPADAVLHRPEGLDAVGGAAVWMPYVTAYGALVETGGMRAGDTVVITAASSSVGLAALQIADRVGATPIATTRTAAKRDALLKAGAADVIVTDEEDVAERVLELTGGRGATFVFDAVAGPGVVELAEALARGGTLFVYGMLSGLDTPFPPMALMSGRAMRSYILHETTRDPEALRRAEAFVASGLRTGAFRPVVDRTFPLEEIADAHRYMEAGTQVGKIVVTVDH
ncbi:zinc-dependent alcohol dehydrogenase family protein [Streptomyces sp. BE20]|uniref:zinc-dependent alcohol dehydrogenase family protein n=1 Tax=Streptomycetaceae TaxID=2062 RepID=UPI002E7645C9|nr:zinc-dependent alcohol dehydrogenase family protein [Streptomyces sp. BE20]MEE1823579.1 zinc-dependent alcohol dehydrogenase family protein [Streptomyces sp. BE20]